jgi:hypothetical protein
MSPAPDGAGVDERVPAAYRAIRLGSVEGDDVLNDPVRAAVTKTLDAAHLLAPGNSNATAVLRVRIRTMDWGNSLPPTRERSVIEYRLNPVDTAIAPFTVVVEARGSASFAEAPIGYYRGRIARERSIRNNLLCFLVYLHADSSKAPSTVANPRQCDSKRSSPSVGSAR